LLEAGAAVDAVEKKGRTPVFFAKESRDEVATGVLLAAGASIDAVNTEDVIETSRSVNAPTINGSTVLWSPGYSGPPNSVVLDLPDWQFDWATDKQPIFPERNPTGEEIAAATKQCELEIGLMIKHRESTAECEQTPMETAIGLAFYKVAFGYAIVNYLDFHTAQNRFSAPKKLKELNEKLRRQ